MGVNSLEDGDQQVDQKDVEKEQVENIQGRAYFGASHIGAFIFLALIGFSHQKKVNIGKHLPQ